MAIQSSVGLISGIDYTTLVEQLIEIERTPITNLETRNEQYIAEETALSELTALFLTASYMFSELAKPATFKTTVVSSLNESLLKASKNTIGTAVPGSYTFTPIRTATSQQTIASGVASATTALNKTGDIIIGNSWKLENDINLNDLNGGDGFVKGYIRITDGSGTRSTIDLRSCVTMNDVLDAINSNVNIDVVAELDGSSLVLTDMSGGDLNNFKVQEVSGGRTAASLGLIGSGIVTDTTEGTITGSSIYYLGKNMQVSSLNDGLGLTFSSTMNDLRITTKDGTEITVDFNQRTEDGGESQVIKELTLGDIIDTINNAQNNDGKIVASIGGADGKSLVITDTTGINYVEAVATDDGSGNITYDLPAGYDANDYEIDSDNYVVDKSTGNRVVDPNSTGKTKIVQIEGNNVPVLKSLGLIDGLWNSNMPVEFVGSITSRSLLSDLDSSLMSTLNGGYGFSNSAAGSIEVQDREGNSATLTFDESELKQMQSGSIGNVIKILNSKLSAANIGIEVTMNDSKTGLTLIDTTTGVKTSNMIFKDKIEQVQVYEDDGITPKVDESNNPVMTDVDPNIAKSLGLDIDSDSSIISGTSLNKQTLSFNTLLSDLNNGKGISGADGQINIVDSGGFSATAFTANCETLGDVINVINDTTRSGTNAPRILARLNSTGDGIEILDLAGGSGSLSITDGTTKSTICSSLGISQTVSQSDRDPVTENLSINGRQSKVISIEATDTLETIRDKINNAGGNFHASIISDGTSLPYRLMITGSTTGTASGMNIDLSAIGLTTENMVEATNAVLVYGDPNSSSALTLQSKSNTFTNAVDGIDVTVVGYSSSPITVTVEESSSTVKAALQNFVTNYNAFREEMTTQTYYYYNDDTKQGGGNTLAMNPTARQFDDAVTKALYKTMSNIPGITSLIDLGIETKSNIDTNGNFIETNVTTNTLTFDEEKFDALWESNREGIEKFFCNEQTIVDPAGGTDPDTGLPKTTTVITGWAKNFTDVTEAITGDSGLVFKRLETLDKTITTNEERIAFLEERVEFKRQTMLNKFYAMEQAMLKMTSSMETVSQIATTWAANSVTTTSS
ncbi:MAG: flagellar filament capping protein FliD [Planctomycetaceae bacterium]|jgi:flagellar hook-associated protein 2|nr:flagellar filament capping protein FliD [Planctomycetaceae bacterium]